MKLCSSLALTALSALPAFGQSSFSFSDGQAPVEVVIPAVVPVIFQVIAPGDAPLILRTTTLQLLSLGVVTNWSHWCRTMSGSSGMSVSL